jgi:hypothetical protein
VNGLVDPVVDLQRSADRHLALSAFEEEVRRRYFAPLRQDDPLDQRPGLVARSPLLNTGSVQ